MTAEIEDNDWISFYNPCGAEAVGGLTNDSCVSAACKDTTCLAKISFQMARYLVNNNTIPELEEICVSDELESHLGHRVVLPNGTVTRITEENKNNITGQISDRAELIVKGVRECEQNTLPLSLDVISRCTEEQIGVLRQLGDIGKQMRVFSGGREQAFELMRELQNTLSCALDLDLEKIGIVVRLSLLAGLADRIGEIESTGLLQIADIDDYK